MVPTSAADVDAVRALIGREPVAPFEVVVRDAAGGPSVIRNAPFTVDGRPMPTRYWLVDRDLVRDVSRLEAAGGVKTAEVEVAADALVAAHHAYEAERDAAVPEGHSGPRPFGGVGGTRQGVKCLHAHYAYWLAGGVDPVGEWVDARLGSPVGSRT
jgi:uncharacterized protein